MQITRRIEFDAGHRVPDHESKCYNLHGHRYVVEATVEGEVQGIGPERGMVIDFGMLKGAMMDHLHDQLDHTMILHVHDPWVEPLAKLNTALVLLPCVPTAENLAAWMFSALDGPLRDEHSVQLVQMRVWETPNCMASYRL